VEIHPPKPHSPPTYSPRKRVSSHLILLGRGKVLVEAEEEEEEEEEDVLLEMLLEMLSCLLLPTAGPR